MMHSITKGREARRNDERLYFKFIVKYFENLHKDLFTEVMNLYKEAKEKNPNVRDLTKTTQFMTAVMPDIPVPRYYNNRHLKVNTTQKGYNTRYLKVNTTQQLQEGPQMVLQIPLHKPQSSPSVTVPVPSPPVHVPSLPVPVPVPVPSPPVPVPVPVPSPPVPVPVPVPLPSPPLLITDNTYQELLAELQRDPDMLQILNDFPFDNDDDDINDLVWDNIYKPDDISPIETEMDQY